MTSGVTSTPPGSAPKKADQHNPAPSAGQLASAITAAKAKLTKAIEENTPGQDDASIEKQLQQNVALSQQVEQLQDQLTELENANPPTDPATLASLQSQMASLNKDLSMLNATSQAFTVDNLLTTQNDPYSSSNPTLAPPVTSPMSPQTALAHKANLFLAPSAITIIFSIMEKVLQQKLKNIDTYRQFLVNYIGQAEQFTLSAAQATIMQGENQAKATMAQATGMLVGGGLQIGLGIASIVATSARVTSINRQYEARINDVKRNATAAGLDHVDDPSVKKQIQDIQLEQQHAISNELQSNASLRALQILEQSSSGLAQGAGNMASAQYTIAAADAEASKLLYQQAIQSAQAIYQDMGQNIQSSSQDITAFFQAFTQIASSMTQQAN